MGINKQKLRDFYRFLLLTGFDPRKTFESFKGMKAFLRDYRMFRKQMAVSSPQFPLTGIYPILSDRFDQAGKIKGHYFLQDLFVAQRVFQNNPEKHVDIGSRIDGFVAHVATFRKIEVMDIRKLDLGLENIKFTQQDIMNISKDLKDYCDSISCLHALEHFGLGRYGDPVDIDGPMKALENIGRLLKPGGRFYFSVPIGQQRVEFNAHRVFSVPFLLSILQNTFKIDHVSYIDDEGLLYRNVDLDPLKVRNNFSCECGCCIFEMTKTGEGNEENPSFDGSTRK